MKSNKKSDSEILSSLLALNKARRVSKEPANADIKRLKNQNIEDYDVRIASQGFANMSGVFAGFSFTSVILVFQISDTLKTLEHQELRDLAAVSFMVSFFGCILASFLFSAISAEKGDQRRANNVAQLTGIGLSISVSLALWGLVTLSRIDIIPI